MDAVILAGGKGTRLRPLTDTRPKPLVPFMSDPFAVGLLRRLAAAGAERATFLVGQDAGPFAALVPAGEALGLEIALVTEPEPLDTAGAVRTLLRAGVPGPVLVCNGDVLCDLDYAGLFDTHVAAGACATLALTRVPDTSSFGVVVCDEAGRVQRFVEKPAPGTLDADTVNAGTYVLDSDVFDRFPGAGPLSFERTVFPGLVAAGELVLGVCDDGYWQDLGTPARYLQAHRAVLDGTCEWPLPPALRRAGHLAAVHDGAVVDASADLGVGVVVGADCDIGAGARLADAVLHRGVIVGAEAQLRGVVLGEGVRVGHGAVLGPDTVLADGAVVAPGARLP